MAEHMELRLLADFDSLAAAVPAWLPQAANTWVRPTPAQVGGELEADERGEVVFAEIGPPVDGIGINDEDLRKVVIVLDGHETGSYVSLSGIRTSLMTPQKERMWNGRLFSFGTPHTSNPLLNTTLKYKQNVTVACLAGPAAAGITGASQAYRVRLWGYVYKASELPGVFGNMGFPAYLVDTLRGRTVVIHKPVNPITHSENIPVTADSWTTLPGGVDQAISKINPFARYAYNRLATDGLQGDYQFRFPQGGVLEEQENLYWEFDDKDALFIESLGVTPSFDTLMPPTAIAFPNLARTGLRIAGDYHPKGPTTRLSLFPTDAFQNQLNYGWLPIVWNAVAPVAPLDVYAVIPKLDRPYLIWNEIGYVVIRDTGVAAAPVPADPLGVTVAMTGIRIEMRS